MSHQPKLEGSISRTLTVLAKKVKQFRLEACAIKERHHITAKTDIVRQFMDIG